MKHSFHRISTTTAAGIMILACTSYASAKGLISTPKALAAAGHSISSYATEDTQRIGERARADSNRTKHYQALLAKAGTNRIRLRALEQYKNALDAAVAKKRAAIDSAVISYRTQVAALTALHLSEEEQLTKLHHLQEAKRSAMIQAGQQFRNEIATARKNLTLQANASSPS